MSDVTVIIPTFNRDKYLYSSICSVLTQTCPPVQVIVVNDGSTDKTEEILDPLKERITYIYQENKGKPEAINRALPLVEGDYIWVFDDDDVACPDALERHLAVLEKRSEIGFTFSSAYYASNHPITGWLCIERELCPRLFPEEDFFAELLFESYTPSPAVVVRTSVQQAAGDYHSDLIRNEDWEMALRWGLIAPAARLPNTRPTYYRRFHEGHRGPQGHQFEANEQVIRGREITRYIYRNFLDYIELHHYLPYPFWNNPLDPDRRRLALSRRLAVRLHKGLWPEALADLDELSCIGFSRKEPTSGEARFLIRGLAHDDALREMQAEGMMEELRRKLVKPGMRPVQRLLSRGLYYKLRGEVEKRNWSEMRTTLSALYWLLGMRGAAGELASRLRGTASLGKQEVGRESGAARNTD